MKKSLFYLLLSFSLFSTVSCNKEDDIAIVSIILDQEHVTIEEGTTFTLSATITPDNATNKTIKWRSNDEDVATVSDGIVVAVGLGGTTITAQAGNQIAECKIYVRAKNMYKAKAFSVSATKQVYFSSGNLQYHCKNKEWCFAPLQYNYRGHANENISETYNNYIDLFGWGTGSNPTLASYDLDDYVQCVDWGTNINDGNTWRTLSYDEWNYILFDRENASDKLGVAGIADGGVQGLVLLPDEWTLPEGLTFNSGFTRNPNFPYKFVNDYSYTDWQKMEQYGAVFLPAAGYRGYGATAWNYSSEGNYWSSTTSKDKSSAYSINFISHEISWNSDKYCCGNSVRLVHD